MKKILMTIVALSGSYYAMAQCDAGYKATPTTADKAHVKVTKSDCKDNSGTTHSGETKVSGTVSGSASGNVGVAKASGNVGGSVEHKGESSSSTSGNKTCTTVVKNYSCQKDNTNK